MIDDVAIYRIQNSDTKLFSLGGAYVSNDAKYKWGPRGKIWNTKRSVNSHLAQYAIQYTRAQGNIKDETNIPENWIVVKQINGAEREYSARDFYMNRIK